MSNITINSLPTASTIDASLDILPIYTASSAATQGISRNTLLGISSQPLGLTDTQSPTNKTFNNTNSYTIKDGSLTIQNTAATTKQATLSLSGITAGQTRIMTLPDYNATLASQAGVETLTNKTLTSPTINSPTMTNATITQDTVTGFTTANSGTVYGGITVTTGNVAMSGTLSVTGLLTPTGGLSTNSVSAAALATSAITLGYAQITSIFTTSATSATQVTGLTTTVTIPAGGRRVKITVFARDLFTNTGTATATVTIWSGTVGSGTQLAGTSISSSTVNVPGICFASHTPAAGSTTYNVGLNTSNGSDSANLEGAATAPAFILVEAI